MNTINTVLMSLIPEFSAMKDPLWRCIDEHIGLKDSEIYEFIPTLESDPFSDQGATLHICYFFYNPKSQRVLFWRTYSKRRRGHSLSDSGRHLSRSVPASQNFGVSSTSSSSFQDSFAYSLDYQPPITDDLDGFYSDSLSDQDSSSDNYLIDDDPDTFNVDI